MTTNAAKDWKRRFIPGVYSMTLLEIGADRGLSPGDLLACAHIDLAPGDIVETGLTFEQHMQLMQVVEPALGDPRLSVEMGWRLPPTALGSVGYAILSSSTLAEALELLQRFWHLIGHACTITVDSRGETSRVREGGGQEWIVIELERGHRVGELEVHPPDLDRVAIVCRFPGRCRKRDRQDSLTRCVRGNGSQRVV